MLIDIAYIIIGVVVAVFSGFFYGRRSGSKSERGNREIQISKQAQEAHEISKRVDDETASISDDAMLERSKRWLRK